MAESPATVRSSKWSMVWQPAGTSAETFTLTPSSRAQGENETGVTPAPPLSRRKRKMSAPLTRRLGSRRAAQIGDAVALLAVGISLLFLTVAHWNPVNAVPGEL